MKLSAFVLFVTVVCFNSIAEARTDLVAESSGTDIVLYQVSANADKNVLTTTSFAAVKSADSLKIIARTINNSVAMMGCTRVKDKDTYESVWMLITNNVLPDAPRSFETKEKCELEEVQVLEAFIARLATRVSEDDGK